MGRALVLGPGHTATAASQRLAKHHLERNESYKEGGRILRPEPGTQAEILRAPSHGIIASPKVTNSTFLIALPTPASL